jgi:hypothetical protein
MFLEPVKLSLSPVPLFLTLGTAALAAAPVTRRAVPMADGAVLVIKEQF